MFEKIEKMRNASPEKKKLVAFSVSLFITGIIFVIWLSVWAPEIFKNKGEVKEEKKFDTPASNLDKNIKDSFKYLKEQILETTDYIKNIR